MRQRIKRVAGLQETFTDLDRGEDNFQPPHPPVVDVAKNESHNHYGQEVESYHPKIYEVFSMTDNNIETTSNHRAIGVDIGTGFISCAEKEADQIKFRKFRNSTNYKQFCISKKVDRIYFKSKSV